MAGMILKVAGRAALVSVLLLVPYTVGIGAAPDSQGRVDVHVANITLAAPGWPSTSELLKPLQGVAQSSVCKDLGSINGVSRCVAFFNIEEVGVLSLQMEAHAHTINASYAVYTTFNSFISASSNFLPSLSAAVNAIHGSVLASAAWMSSAYTMPCRGIDSSAVLPTCADTKNCGASLVIEGATAAIHTALCSLLPSPCDNYLISTTSQNGDTDAQIKDYNALEVALSFTDLVRNGRVGGVKHVFLQSGERKAQMFAHNEKMRYHDPLKIEPQCDSIYGLWALSILAIVPVLLVLFRYVWHTARHQAKKKARRAIIENELQLQMQERQQQMDSQYNMYDPEGGMYPQREGEEQAAEQEQDPGYYAQREGIQEYVDAAESEVNLYNEPWNAAQYQGNAQSYIAEEEDTAAMDNADEYVEPGAEEMFTIGEDEGEGRTYYVEDAQSEGGDANAIPTEGETETKGEVVQ